MNDDKKKREPREQRIKLRIEGSPVKWDGTIIESTPDSKRIKVRFDGPLGEVEFLSMGDTMLISDPVDQDGKPVNDPRMAVKCRYWNVL